MKRTDVSISRTVLGTVTRKRSQSIGIYALHTTIRIFRRNKT